MTSSERVRRVLSFERPDRMPIIEWATWWDKTIDRWRGEGLPDSARSMQEIADFLGLDVHYQYWLPARKEGASGGEEISSLKDYIEFRECLYPEKAIDHERLGSWVRARERGDAFIWITLDGSFWFPRRILGIEKHLYSLVDRPDVIHAINRDLAEHQLRLLDEFCSICVPDFATFAEDMSYNHGSMIDETMFDEFMAPYYRMVIPKLDEYGITPIIDSDGLVDELVPWFHRVGVDGFLPLERQAGVDIAGLRREHPRLRMVGAFDKMTMNRGEEETRAEFERILPVIQQGGYIASVDHQTPPGVSLSEYRRYVKLLKEYAVKAVAK